MFIDFGETWKLIFYEAIKVRLLDNNCSISRVYWDNAWDRLFGNMFRSAEILIELSEP